MADECGCDCTAGVADAAAGFSSSNKGGNSNGVSSPSKPMIGGAPSPAPTAEEYWMVYFTDGEIGESYVWWMESDAEKIRMNVLLDSTGEATGLVSDLNNTHVIFGTADGGIYSVSTDGYGLTEIVEDMGDVTAIGAMDIDYNEEMLYFVNSDNGEIWRVKTDGSSAQKLTDLIPDAFGIAVDAHKSMLFVSASSQSAMYSMYMDGSDVTKVFETPTSPYGLACDASTHTLFWAGGESVYKSALSGEGMEAMFTGSLVNVTDVTVDYVSDILFFVDSETIYKSTASGHNDYSLVKQHLKKLRYVFVVGETPPTTSPTPVPTSVPTSVPTAVPTAVPFPAPSSVPSPVPTAVPTAVPSSVPTAVPSGVPTAVPTAVPSSVPTAVPTSVPTAVPSAVPTAVPTSVPTSVPTALPSPLPTSVPTAVPTSVPTPAPSSICEFYESQCGLCSGSECNWAPSASPVAAYVPAHEAKAAKEHA